MRIAALSTALVTLIVAVIVIALVAVPVVEDASKGTPYTSENSGYDARYALLTSPTFEMTIQSGVTTVTIDGRTETVPVNDNVPVLLAEDLAIRSRASGTTYYDLANNTWSSVTAESGTALTVTAENGSYTMTRGGTAIASGTMDKCFIRSATGDLGVFSGSPKVTIGNTYYIGSFFSISANGPMRLYSATDGNLGSAFIEPFSASTIEGSHVVLNGWTVTAKISYDEIGGNQAVGMVNYADWTWSDGTTSGSGNTTYTIAPIAFTSTAGTGDDTNSILLSIIPIMLIIVAIMVAVRIIRDP